jgi:hypothetical protein
VTIASNGKAISATSEPKEDAADAVHSRRKFGTVHARELPLVTSVMAKKVSHNPFCPVGG